MEKQGVMRLRDAAAQLGVSEMTIRRDMAQRDLNGGDLARSDSDVLKGLNCLGGYIHRIWHVWCLRISLLQ